MGGTVVLRQHGMALLFVLWITLLVALLLAGTLSVVRIEARIASSEKRIFLAEQELENTLSRIKQGIASGSITTLEGLVRFRRSVADVEVKVVEVVDEGSKVDVNFSPEFLVVEALQKLGLELEQAESYAAEIAQWRSSEDGLFQEGRKFFSVTELHKILELTPEAESCLPRYFTVHGYMQDPTHFRDGAQSIDPRPEERGEDAEEPFLEPQTPLLGRKLSITLRAYHQAAEISSRRLVIQVTGRSEEPLLVLANDYVAGC